MQKRLFHTIFLTGAMLLVTSFFSCKKEEPAPLPFADYFVSNSGCTSPCWMHFYDHSVNAVQWEWNFGNGFNSTTKNDSMLYDESGLYDVWLWAYNTDGVADSVMKTVMVY